MKKIVIAISFVIFALGCQAQVTFSKFKFIKDSPFGCCPGRRATDVKFEVTGDRMVKYIRVLYVGVNQVGDAVSGDIVGAVNAGKEHTKNRILNLTGPFEPGQAYSRWASASFIYKLKVTAFPLEINIIYRDGEEEAIAITQENINTYFPKVKWMEVNMEDGY